jgi:SAM-dependent methyltransferase
MRDTERKRARLPPKRFSTEITALVYDFQSRPDAPDVAFWVDWCQEVGGPVLELGCGNGRVAIPLARAGLEVVGIELSPVMLAAAEKRVAEEPPDVRRRVSLVRADMRHFELGFEVGCAIIPASTFSVLLTRRDQQRTLASVRACLPDKGPLAFELRLFDDWLSGSRQLPPVRRSSDDGSVDFTEERRFEFDPSTRVFTSINTYTFHSPEHLGRVAESQKGRVVSRPEVEEVLQSSGFAVEAVWGDYDRRPFAADSSKMIFVARRVDDGLV